MTTKDNLMMLQKLTDKQVKAASTGTHEDGGGLRLVVSESGTRRWILRITVQGKRREMGLGGYTIITLANARMKAEVVRKQIVNGIDPFIEHTKAHTIGNKVEAAYRRGNLLEKRRAMMEDWCLYITPHESHL